MLTTRGYRLARVALVAIIAATGIWVAIVAIRLAVPAADLRRTADVPPLFVAAMNGWLCTAAPCSKADGRSPR